MVKVYLPSFAICTFSLTVHLLVLGTYPSRAIAQESVSQTSNEQSTSVEPEILAEINRVRTNPQGYARWLEEQKQYYDNIWLRLPGEEPIRAHRLGRAINEAIAILQEQQPLPPLDISEQTSAVATQKLEDFAAANNNVENISYGRQTAKGIVMSLVVDELFRDRRRRKSLLSPNANDTGIICESDPRYAKVCAIAYSDSTVDEPAEKQPETSTAETEIAQQPSPPEETETAIDEPESSAEAEPAPEESETETTEDTETVEDTETAENTEDTEIAENTETAEQLPQPPVPQELPAPVDEPLPDLPTPEAETEPEDEPEIAQAEAEEPEEVENDEVESDEAEEPEAEENDEELEEVEQEIEEAEQELEEIEQELAEEEKEEVFEVEAEPEDESDEVATNSDSSRFLENVERGALEEGDRVIEEDGSFYDSYPLEAESGESFTIALESDEFDAFVALIDSQGNIVEQNDDISEEDSNSRIRVTIPENGVYNVIVNAYDEGGTGQYVLTVTR